MFPLFSEPRSSARPGRARPLLFAPLARRGAEPLLEDTAEVGEVTKAPRVGDLADMPRRLGGIRQIALAALQALSLNIAAERRLFRGHQFAGIARRDPDGGGHRRNRQLGIAKAGQDKALEAIEQRRAME